MTQQRYSDTLAEWRDHCPNHDRHQEKIETNEIAQTKVSSSLITLKWVIGLGLPAFIAIFTLVATLIISELKDIKAAVNSIAMDQVQVKSELENVKWRLDQLEAK